MSSLSFGLGTTNSRSNAVDEKPFSTPALRENKGHSSHSGVFATTTKICTEGGSTAPHGRASQHTLAPSYSFKHLARFERLVRFA